MISIQEITEIADDATSSLSLVIIENNDDRAHAAEVVRQTAQRVCAYKRSGWKEEDYSTLGRVVRDSAWRRVLGRPY